VEAGVALNRKGRGALIDDYNLDGEFGLLVVNRGAAGASSSAPRSRAGRRRRWAIGAKSGLFSSIRDAVGAKLAVKIGARTLYRTIQFGVDDASGHAGWVHVGLGAAEQAEIRVKWPEAERSHPFSVFANQFVIVGRAKSEVLVRRTLAPQGVAPSASRPLEPDLLRAFPKRHLAELGQILQPRCDRDEVVAGELAHFAGEMHAAISEQDLSLADPAGIKNDLTRRRIGCMVLVPDFEIHVAERDPHAFAAPADMDDVALER
jgi:hypothetical protein